MNIEKKQKLEDLRRVRLADTFIYPVAVVGCTGNLLFSSKAAKLLGLGRNRYVQFHNDIGHSKDDVITVGEHPRPGWPVCWFRHWLKKIFYLPLANYYEIVKEFKTYKSDVYILRVEGTGEVYGGSPGFRLKKAVCVPGKYVDTISSMEDCVRGKLLYSLGDKEKILSIISDK